MQSISLWAGGGTTEGQFEGFQSLTEKGKSEWLQIGLCTSGAKMENFLIFFFQNVLTFLKYRRKALFPKLFSFFLYSRVFKYPKHDNFMSKPHYT